MDDEDDDMSVDDTDSDYAGDGPGPQLPTAAPTTPVAAIPAAPASGRSPIPPGIKRNSRGEPYNLDDAPGQQISAAEVTPERMHALAAANASTSSTTSSDGVVTNVADTPITGAQGRALSALPAAESEKTPILKKPPIDPRPFAWVQKNKPEVAGWINDAAELTGVSPERIAAHMYVESKFNPNTPRGKDGEIGPMQIMPSTGKNYTMGGRLDISNPQDNVLMGALYMRDLDAQYGKDSLNSVRHYNGSGPMSWEYVSGKRTGFNFFPGTQINDELRMAAAKQAEGGSATPRGLFDAAKKDGPNGFLNYIVQTAPAGMPLSDAWRHAEGLLVNAMISKGDMAGAQHARDFIFQLSHAGSNEYLMAAHQALQRGDGVGASQLLAKAHAFFPDGTVGRFRTDGQNVYAERMDESDPSRRLGPPMKVTANDVAGMLNQTTNPQQYLKTLMEQQKTAAQMRMYQTHGDYYAALTGKIPEQLAIQQGQLQLGQTKADNALSTAVMREAGANERADKRNATTLAAAGMRAGVDRSAEHAVQKEANDIYNPQMAPDDPNLGRKSTMYVNLRRAGITGPQSQVLTQGLASGELQVRMSPDHAQAAVFDKSGKPIQYLPPALVSQLAGPSVPQQSAAMPTSPVGALPSTAPPTLGGAQR